MSPPSRLKLISANKVSRSSAWGDLPEPGCSLHFLMSMPCCSASFFPGVTDGLIFRGIAFGFRYRSERMRSVWDWGFFVGSAVVAFAQGPQLAP
jgi:hypothetical protein